MRWMISILWYRVVNNINWIRCFLKSLWQQRELWSYIDVIIIKLTCSQDVVLNRHYCLTIVYTCIFLTFDSFTFQKEILQGVGEDRVLHQRQTVPWMRQFRDYNNSLFQTFTGVMRAKNFKKTFKNFKVVASIRCLFIFICTNSPSWLVTKPSFAE